MASDRRRAWIERLVWILLYAGLFAVVLGLAAMNYHAIAAGSLLAVGGAMAIAGIVLIWVRSRMDGG